MLAVVFFLAAGRLLPAALLACQQPLDISEDIESYATAVSDVNAIACDCPQNLGYSTNVECDEALGPVGTGDRDCIGTVLDGHEDDAADYHQTALTASPQLPASVRPPFDACIH